jgi:SAM-dependent methyltransferase
VLVGRVTDDLLAQGRTVYQMFLLDPDERLHAQAVLAHVFVPIGGRVLSLGCGVGGMERHWVDAMPSIEVTLVNQSMAQLARCVCPGARVLADMRDGPSLPGSGYDVVVLGYSLHHVDDVPAMLAVAYSMLRPGGTLLVLDVCDGSPGYEQAVQYRTLHAGVLAHCGLVRLDHGLTWHPMPAEVVGQHVASLLVPFHVRPGMWVGMA